MFMAKIYTTMIYSWNLTEDLFTCQQMKWHIFQRELIFIMKYNFHYRSSREVVKSKNSTKLESIEGQQIYSYHLYVAFKRFMSYMQEKTQQKTVKMQHCS